MTFDIRRPVIMLLVRGKLAKVQAGGPQLRPGDDIIMGLLESDIHSFIVKIWLEETSEETGQVTWRGHITHVLSGERRYFKDLDDVMAFITSYLEKYGNEG